MAIPQYAMPHFGSDFATSANPFSASSYQKECKRATARLNCCGDALHDMAKLTRPSFSPMSCRCCDMSWALNVSGQSSAAKDPATKNRLIFITDLPIWCSTGWQCVTLKFFLFDGSGRSTKL